MNINKFYDLIITNIELNIKFVSYFKSNIKGSFGLVNVMNKIITNRITDIDILDEIKKITMNSDFSNQDKIYIINNININHYLDLNGLKDEYFDTIFGFLPSPFMPCEIYSNIINNINSNKNTFTNIYIFKLHDNIKIRLMVPNWINKIELDNIINICKFMTVLYDSTIKLINPIIFKNYKKTLRINYFPSNINKSFISLNSNNSNKHFTVDIVNSASAEIYGENIVIFRTEEIYKIIIHEIFHIFDVANIYLNLQLPVIINNDQNNNPPFKISETICECLATIINPIYDTYDMNEILKIINLELEFGLLQTAKILYFAGFNNITDFFYNTNNIKLYQDTSVVEYYILKTMCLYKLNDFIDSILNSKIKEDIVQKLYIIFNDCINDKNYLNSIQKKFNEIIIKNNTISDFTKYTARMTIYHPKFNKSKKKYRLKKITQ